MHQNLAPREAQHFRESKIGWRNCWLQWADQVFEMTDKSLSLGLKTSGCHELCRVIMMANMVPERHRRKS